MNIAYKWTLSTLSEIKHLILYNAIKNIPSILSKLECVHFSALDSLSKQSKAPLLGLDYFCL
jgi:hypothetical protein